MAERKSLLPGSEEARAEGCRCPVLDNRHGQGLLGEDVKPEDSLYWVDENCPLHGCGEAP
jgi:hypothetical protein